MTATCETDDGLVLRLRKKRRRWRQPDERRRNAAGKKTTTVKTISRDGRRAMAL